MKYQIRIFDEADHEFMSIKEAYWGACLNDTVYIYQDLENASSKPRIYPIQFIDRYSFFSGYSSKTSGAIENGPGSYNHGDLGDSPFVLNTTTKEGEFIININNGIIYELSDKLIKAILKDDPELSNLYENDKDKKENFKKYILEYNRRHPDKIKPMNH